MDEIQLTGVSKSYGKEVAVENLDLTVDPGEFLTILGPSGCGKTTTLRLIAGLEEPDSGEIRLGSKVVFSRRQGVIVPPEHRNLGLIFQSYALWPHMTVERNVTLALKEKKLSSEEIEKRLTAALEKVHLEPYRGRYPSELSGGQQQRVAVARLIALQSSVLLMVEPLSNLDAMLRTDMRGELKRLHRELEATTVYVTHDQIEALTLSDTIAIMDRGVIRQQASPFEIYHHPANLFVAQFVGSPRINRLAGTVRRHDGAVGVDFGDIWLPLERDIPSKSGKMIVTVRPESIQLSRSEKEGWLKVRLDSVLPTGPDTILQASSELAEFTMLQPGFFEMPVDEYLWLHFESDSLNFFDAETGRNLLSE